MQHYLHFLSNKAAILTNCWLRMASARFQSLLKRPNFLSQFKLCAMFLAFLACKSLHATLAEFTLNQWARSANLKSVVGGLGGLEGGDKGSDFAI